MELKSGKNTSPLRFFRLLIAPLMELKFTTVLPLKPFVRTFNRTAYGIEMKTIT